MPVIHSSKVSQETEDAKHLARGYGPFVAQLFSDDGGLTQFGAFTETLKPGSRSGAAHWHENEDEFIYVVNGTVRVYEGDEMADLYPGDAACFKAGVAIGHYLENVSDTNVMYLVVGTRAARDVAHLTDQDAILHRDGAEKVWVNVAGETITR